MRWHRLMGIVVSLAVFAFVLLIAAAQDLADEQAAWEKLGVEDYHIAVQDAGVWSVLNIELWVQDGGVKRLRAECQPGLVGTPCQVFTVDARDFEVGELFNRVHSAGARLANVEYDPNYHFPALIFEDDRQVYDDEHGLRVTIFEELSVGEMSPDDTLTATPEPAAQVLQLTPVEPQDDLDSWLDEAETAGNQARHDSYRLTLSETTPWNGTDLTLEVRNGAPVRLDASCHPGWMRGPCAIDPIDPQAYTLPGLFERAREAAGVASSGNDVLAFDAETGIPLRLFYDDPNIADEEWEIVVTQVALLDAPAEP